MAITFDATAGQETATSPNTFAHTCTGASRILFVGFFADAAPTAVTYNLTGMTLISSTTRPGNTDKQYLYYLVNPAVGTHNVIISATGATIISASSSSYAGALQTGVPDAQTNNTSTGAVTTKTTTLITIADNSWTVLTAIADNRSLAAGTGSTLRTATGTSNLQGIFDSNAAITPAGSTSMDVSFGLGSNVAIVMASFAPAVVAATSIVAPTLAFMGAG